MRLHVFGKHDRGKQQRTQDRGEQLLHVADYAQLNATFPPLERLLADLKADGPYAITRPVAPYKNVLSRLP